MSFLFLKEEGEGEEKVVFNRVLFSDFCWLAQKEKGERQRKITCECIFSRSCCSCVLLQLHLLVQHYLCETTYDTYAKRESEEYCATKVSASQTVILDRGESR